MAGVNGGDYDDDDYDDDDDYNVDCFNDYNHDNRQARIDGEKAKKKELARKRAEGEVSGLFFSVVMMISFDTFSPLIFPFRNLSVVMMTIIHCFFSF